MFLFFGTALFAVKVQQFVCPNVITAIAAVLVAKLSPGPATALDCPADHRLHDQGFCIHQADELAGSGYKFINMAHGEE